MTGNYWTDKANARLGRRRLLQVAGAGSLAAAGAAVVGCGDDDDDAAPAGSPGTGTQSEQPKRGGIYRVSTTGSAPTLDMYRTTSFLTAPIAGGVLSHLMINQGDTREEYPTFRVQPDLAASYETPDPLTYNFRLRPNIKIHPPISRLMNAEDVALSWERFNGRTQGSQPAAYLAELNMIDSLRAVDPTTVQIKLKRPFGPLLNKLADDYFFVVYPREVGTGFDPTRTLVGTGPWMLTEYTNNVGHKLRRHPEWHLGPDKPYLEGVDSAVVPEYATSVTQLMAGNLDTLGNLTPDDVLRARDQIRGSHVWSGIDPYMACVSFSAEPNAPWRDVRVRQAISMALDRDAIYELLYDAKKLTNAGLQVEVKHHNMYPVGYGNRYWVDPNSAPANVRPLFKYDPDGARRLLTEAGFPNGFSAPYHYSEIYGQNFKQNAEIVQQMLGRVGIRLTSVVEDVTTYTSRTNVGNYDGLAFIYWGFAYPEHLLEFLYQPGAPRNTSKVNDPQITERMNAIIAEQSADRRAQMIKDIQTLLAEKMYYVPAVYDSGPRWNVSQPHIKNAGQFRTVRSGGTSVGNVNLWLDK
jgi:peptide/nickel transport system substrate-binding protein